LLKLWSLAASKPLDALPCGLDSLGFSALGSGRFALRGVMLGRDGRHLFLRSFGSALGFGLTAMITFIGFRHGNAS
jgi:hypothetical protein